MAKIIKLTDECIDEIKKDFEEALNSAKFSDGKINFTRSFGSIKRNAVVYFTELAWIQMQTLIKEFDKEVAWHGIARRGDDESKDEYYIDEILVYPQQVTGATVNTDQEEYQMWLMNHDDEVFNKIRMQGHSHVNMQVTPSGVDTSMYDRILEQLDDTMFYIFMIWNKRGEKTIKIYDLAKNVMFDTNDCEIKILDDIGINIFLSDAKEMVKDKVYTPVNKRNDNDKPNAKEVTELKSSGKNEQKRKGIRRGNRNNNATSSDDDLVENWDDDWDDWKSMYNAYRRYDGYDY